MPPGDKTNYISYKPAEIISKLDSIKQSGVEIYRIKKDGEWVKIPYDKVNFFSGGQDLKEYKFYIRKDWEKIANDKAGKQKKLFQKANAVQESDNNPGTVASPRPVENKQINFMIQDYLKNLKRHQDMSVKERADEIKKSKENLKKNLSDSETTSTEAAQTISETTRDALFSNTSTLSEIFHGTKKNHTVEEICNETSSISDSVVKYIHENSNTKELFEAFSSFSTGSTVGHMNRVYILFISFILFYNKKLQAGFANHLRVKFPSQYAPFYTNLLPDYGKIHLEQIFEHGIRLLNIDEVSLYSMGCMLHDLGKLPDLKYHESAAAYDRKVIIRHASHGYGLIAKTGEYPDEVSFIAGNHHEYYNHEKGYGIFRVMLKNQIKRNKLHKVTHCISYSMTENEKCNAWSYFPAKVLEVVDVYDGLTDRSRKYRGDKILTPEIALTIMKEEFLENHIKLDPILYNLFLEFLITTVIPEEKEKISKLYFHA